MKYVVMQRVWNPELAKRLGLASGWLARKHYNTREAADRAAKTLASNTICFTFRVIEKES